MKALPYGPCRDESLNLIYIYSVAHILKAINRLWYEQTLAPSERAPWSSGDAWAWGRVWTQKPTTYLRRAVETHVGCCISSDQRKNFDQFNFVCMQPSAFVAYAMGMRAAINRCFRSGSYLVSTRQLIIKGQSTCLIFIGFHLNGSLQQ